MRTHRCFSCGAALLACWFSLVPLARAGSATFIPVADTTLIQTRPDNNLGGQIFFTAGVTETGPQSRGLLRYDLSGLPANATILSVNLSIEVVGLPANGFGSTSFSLYRVLRPWGEGNKWTPEGESPGQGLPADSGEATWNHRLAGTAETWASPGGSPGVDYFGGGSSTTDSSVGSFGSYLFPTSPAFVADVQGWLLNPAANFGWMMIADDASTRFTARRFASREASGIEPMLALEYEVVPEPSSVAIGAIGLAVAAAFRRGRRPGAGS